MQQSVTRMHAEVKHAGIFWLCEASSCLARGMRGDLQLSCCPEIVL